MSLLETNADAVFDGIDEADELIDGSTLGGVLTEGVFVVIRLLVLIGDIDVIVDGLGDPDNVDETEREWVPLAQPLIVADVVPDREGLVLPVDDVDTDDVAVKVLFATEPVDVAVGDVDSLAVAVVVSVLFIVLDDSADSVVVLDRVELRVDVAQLDSETDTDLVCVPLAHALIDIDIVPVVEILALPVAERCELILPVVDTVEMIVIEFLAVGV